MAGLELHQHVDVAVRTEVVPKNGAEQRQAPDMVASTEPLAAERQALTTEQGNHFSLAFMC